MIAWKPLGALALVLSGAGLLAVPPPAPGTPPPAALEAARNRVASRELHVDAAEMLELLHEDLVPSQILDTRGEADYNLFRLQDSVPLDLRAARELPGKAVKFLVSNDEAGAEEAAVELLARGVLNVYILEGGLNRWIQWVEEGPVPDQGTPPGPEADGSLRHPFRAALGARHPASAPDPEHVPVRLFEEKVKIAKPKGGGGGGCG